MGAHVNQPRHQRGAPTGGRWMATARAAADSSVKLDYDDGDVEAT